MSLVRVAGAACLVILLAAVAVGRAADDTAPAFSAGFSERDITPKPGMERPGGYGKVYHKELHDPCKVRAAVFDDGGTRVAIVSVDALLLRRALVEAARRRIHQECGIEPEAVLIHATHSHSSGPTGMIYPGEYDHASKLVQELAYEKSSNANLEYVRHVEDQIVDAVVTADDEKTARAASVGVGCEEHVAYNRRFFMQSGYTHTHPRPGNPDIIEPAGPTDPEVGVIGVWDDMRGETLVGCIVNFSCHATASPGGISANYIYYVEQVIRAVFGEQVVLVFLAGASGDVTQVENLTPYARRPAEESSRFVGGSIGAEAVQVLLREPRGALGPLAFKTRMLEIPRRVPAPERVAKCLEIVKQPPLEVGRSEWTFAKEIVLLDARLKTHPFARAEVQAIQLGPAVLLSDPAEFFVQLGLDIKQDSPFEFTFPVSLANGCVGYVPTPESFGPRGGGYETRLTSYSNLEITAGTQMVDAAVELARSLTPGKAPTRPPAAPLKDTGWAYGNVPPELD